MAAADDVSLTVEHSDGTDCSHGSFRDCSVCLEILHNCYDAEQKERKMTFIVPCGLRTRLSHGLLSHVEQKTRFTGGQALQCATCNGPATASYYVMADYRCILCRQSVYASRSTPCRLYPFPTSVWCTRGMLVPLSSARRTRLR